MLARICALFPLLLVLTHPLNAEAFTPQMCGLCSANQWTTLGWYYADDEWLGTYPVPTFTEGDGFVQHQLGSDAHYENNIDNVRMFLASANVSGLRVFYDHFETEPGYDFVSMQQSSTMHYFTGVQAANSWTQIAITSPLQWFPMTIRFKADISIRQRGFLFNKVQVCCSPNPAYVSQTVALGVRQTGVLQGLGDVVYLRISDPPIGQIANLMLWSLPGRNFDLKVRCDAFPTPTNYDASATTLDEDEMLQVPRLGCSTGLIYVAVYNAGNVTGQFNFIASRMKTSMLKDITVGLEGPFPTATQLSAMKKAVVNSAKRYFGATEGQHFIRSISWLQNTGTNCTNCGSSRCDVCIKSGTIRAENVGGPCAGWIKIDQNAILGEKILNHEWGHRYFCVRDEYKEKPGSICPLCGHTIMNGPVGISLNDFCIDTETFVSHHRDGQQDLSDCTGNVYHASWQDAPSGANLVFTPHLTPDPFNYVRHSFNDLIQTQ